MELRLGLIGLGLLIVLFVGGAVVLAASIEEPLSADSRARLPWWRKKATDWQKVVFLAYVVVGPLYLLWDWFHYGSGLQATELANFQYTQKLIGELWSSGAIMFGLFWGLKK